ncbi:hypothetical protein [Sphingobium sp.]|uniref:hypothetical protein n=1 Tax=Sphingobium sp. TaxID=1912891 RepID=UPI0028BD7EF1|nr:hypothetical protein [Sphingobium sp.]
MTSATRFDRWCVQQLLGSLVAGGAMSALTFRLTFGDIASVPVWGWRNLAFDALPQSFMGAVMGVLVPALVARRTFAGRPASSSGAPPIQLHRVNHIIARALLAGIAALPVGYGIWAGGLWFATVSGLPFDHALLLKTAYGGVLSMLFTGCLLRDLRRSFPT